MNISHVQAGLSEPEAVGPIPNGPGAAAILAAGIGSAALGILSLAGDAWAAIGKSLNFYNPTGTLSSVTTVTIVIWLASWYILNLRWRTKNVAVTRVNISAFIGLAIGLALTFPPVMDLIQGK
ncbi:MAG: hypothetical protein ABI541_04100 [Betaproteobacteria bacterium]